MERWRIAYEFLLALLLIFMVATWAVGWLVVQTVRAMIHPGHKSRT